MDSGYYSIVQYMPWPKRHEGINFGLMLLNTSTGHFDAILTHPVPRIRAMFPGTTEMFVRDLSKAFFNRIASRQFSTLGDLTEFVLTRENVVQCTEPEWVKIEKDGFYAVLEDLLYKLVL